MSDSEQLKDLEAAVGELAREAGRRILEVYETAFAVEHKRDKSPVTEADYAAHEVISAGLDRLTPDLPLLSEEGGLVSYEQRAGWRRYWLIDPLDGTREFVKRNGEFVVSIALIRDHRPELGVVYAPVKQWLYCASRGNGAHKQVGAGTPRPIRVRPAPDDTLTIAGSRSHSDRRLAEYLDRLGRHELVSLGSALKACLVAEGGADLYPRFGPTSEWDTAGAQCIVEEAGGAVTDFKRQPLRYNTRESLINPSFLVFGDSSRDWAKPLEPPK